MLKVNVIMISFIYCSGAINSLRKKYYCFYLHRVGGELTIFYLSCSGSLAARLINLSFICIKKVV